MKQAIIDANGNTVEVVEIPDQPVSEIKPTSDERIASLEAQNKSLQEQIDLLVSGVTT